MMNRSDDSVRIVSYGGTYLGRRVNNEDSLGRTVPHDVDILNRKGRLYVVCDGMGGTKGGEIASQIAVETIIESYYENEDEPEVSLCNALNQASLRIAAYAEQNSEYADMGSTAAAIVVLNNCLILAHVGDSRIYLMRQDKLIRLTKDHLHIIESLGVSEQEAETHPNKNILSRALGYVDASEPDSSIRSGCAGDRILLCSDGLTDSISEDNIEGSLLLNSPRKVVEKLLELAENSDAHDNTTALVIFLQDMQSEDEPTLRDSLDELKFLIRNAHSDNESSSENSPLFRPFVFS